MSLAPHRKLAEANSLPHQVDLNAPLIDWLIPSLGLLSHLTIYRMEWVVTLTMDTCRQGDDLHLFTMDQSDKSRRVATTIVDGLPKCPPQIPYGA